jgi:hypothetical protein
VPTHIDALAALCLDCVVGDASGAFVIAQDDGGRLWVPEVVEDSAQIDSVFAVEKHGAVFCFCCGGGHAGYYGAVRTDGSIDVGGAIFIPQVEKPPETERAAERERYDASLWMCRTMSHAVYLIAWLGCNRAYLSSLLAASTTFSVACACSDAMPLSAVSMV